MRILIVSQYFWPEHFRINEITQFLRKKKCNVDILTALPNYPDGEIFPKFLKNKKKYSKYYGAKVFRLPVVPRKSSNKFWLFFNYISFVISGFLIAPFFLRKRKYDAVFTFATSPITVALLANYISKIKNTKSFLWVLDYWPEILDELKIIKNRIIYKIINQLVKKIYKDSDFIFAQSQSFKEFINEKIDQNYKVSYLPAWPEILKKRGQIKLDKKKIKDKLKIVFTGNVGEAQNFNNILRIMIYFKNYKNILWVIVGSGRKLNEIIKSIKYHKVTNVIFEGNQPSYKIKHYHDLADVLLISLSEGKYLSGTIPGKLQTYLDTNKIILGMISGEASRIIKESKSGFVIKPNDTNGMKSKIKFILKNKKKLIHQRKKVNTRKYLSNNFGRQKVLNNLYNFLQKNAFTFSKIKLIQNLEKIPFDKNFVLSGLNLAFLGFYSMKKVSLYETLYHWPDGIYAKKITNNNVIKIPGRTLIQKIKIPKQISRIYIIGNLNKNSKKYLYNLYQRKIIHLNVPFGSSAKIYKFVDNIKFKKHDIIFLTIPTPKQEQVAEMIANENKYYKILCIGGAVNMASGEEKPVPDFMDKAGIEFLWRLRTDPLRRFWRLLNSFYSYSIGNINKSISSTQIKLIK